MLIVSDKISHFNYVFKRCDANFNPVIYYCKSSSYFHMGNLNLFVFDDLKRGIKFKNLILIHDYRFMLLLIN